MVISVEGGFDLRWYPQLAWWQRLRGLLGRPEPLPGEAWWFMPCRAVHTVGMRYCIDVVFLDAGGIVLRVCRALPPGRMAVHWRALSVVELATGECRRLGIQPGSRLQPPARTRQRLQR